MKCVVVGGAGFIGSNLVDRLIKDGHKVLVLDNLSTGKKENINEKADFVEFDISKNWDELGITIEKIDVVFHLAAKARVQPSIENPIEFNDVNVVGMLNLLQFCVDNNVKRFIYSSSSSVYGEVKELPTKEDTELNPMSPYALQKLIGEQYCKLYSELYNIETVSLRYFNVYGERQLLEGAYCLVMGKFIQQRLNDESMTIRGDGKQRRDFTYVGDVVDANIKAMDYPLELNGDVFNIGNGDNRSVNDIANLIGGDTLQVEPVIEPKETLADNTKAKKSLKWKPKTKIETWVKKYKKELGL
jgi:nucleoside-diphosphate-sugar epimerase